MDTLARNAPRWLAAAAIAAACSTAQAAEVGLGLGYDDILGNNGTGAGALGVQLTTDPLAHLGPVGIGLGLALEIDTDADFWGGAGVAAAAAAERVPADRQRHGRRLRHRRR
jgi:hypothetical protein